MIAKKLLLCLSHLDAAETALLDAEDWTIAAHLSLVIDRLRLAHGLPERPVDFSEVDDTQSSDRARAR